MYPILENALRARAGRSIAAQQHFLAELMFRYSQVAERNPFSWFPEPRTAEEIARVDARNRWIGFPYPKLMNAIVEVDQGAAAIVMSESAADALGIAPGRRVHFLGGASAQDGWSAAERFDLASSPAYAAAAREAQAHASLGIADVDLCDLYSCFPSAVELALDALGVSASDPRPPGAVKLAGGSGLWRIRIGNYRVVYLIDDRRKTVDIRRFLFLSDPLGLRPPFQRANLLLSIRHIRMVTCTSTKLASKNFRVNSATVSGS